MLDNASPGKRFWGYVKSKSSQTSIPDLVSYKNVSANTPVDIANLFGCFFSECCNRDDVSDTVIPDYDVTSSISYFTCYPTDVIKLIRKLDNKSAAGVDGITSIMLKNTATSVSTLLTHLFNLSLSTGSVPSAWKLSRVIPIFKSGDRQSASNYMYRPISLQPIIGKLLERLIHQNILQHLRINNILTPRQFGFLPQSSTSNALTTALHDWYLTLEKRRDIAVALFDLTKAFDRVPHGPLLLKLRSVGITGPLLSWLRSYLADRTQVVAVHGITSDTVPVISGVPQCSVLGPLLFLSMLTTCVSLISPKTVPWYSMLMTPPYTSQSPVKRTSLTSRKTLMLSITGFVLIISQQMPARPKPWSFLPRKTLILICSSLDEQPTHRKS